MKPSREKWEAKMQTHMQPESQVNKNTALALTRTHGYLLNTSEADDKQGIVV